MIMQQAPVRKTLGNYELTPPQDYDAETAVIGGLLENPGWFGSVADILKEDDFFELDYRLLWRIISNLVKTDRPVDLVEVRAELVKLQQWKDFGGVEKLQWIHDCREISWPTCEYRCRRVKRASTLRTIIDASARSSDAAYSARIEDADEVLVDTIKRLTNVLNATGQRPKRRFSDYYREMVKELKEPTERLMPFGYPTMDRALGGIGKGEMHIVGARPSMGKSLLLKCMALRMARMGISVGYISIEESGKKITRNLVANMMDIRNAAIRKGAAFGSASEDADRLTPEDFARIERGEEQSQIIPITIEDRAFTLDAVTAAMMRLVGSDLCEVLFIDYLQLIHVPGLKTEYERASFASREVSRMLKQLNVPGIVAAQVNRGSEVRDDKRPRLSDLRSSGQIEQDADGVFLIHREDYHRTSDPSWTPNREVEVIVAKMRDAERGRTLKLLSNLRYQRFDDPLETGEDHPSFD